MFGFVDVCFSSLAKVHAVSFAIKAKTPRLFDEISGSLTAPPSGARRKVCWEERVGVLLDHQRCHPTVREKIVQQVADLTSCFTTTPFSVLVHGNSARGSTFKYNVDSRSDHLLNLYSCFLFVKKSLICLEGILMTLIWENIFLFCSSCQLSRLGLGTLMGFLS